MVDLRELIAEAIDKVNDYDWETCLGDADFILAALDAAGLVVVPREPTEEMVQAWHDADLVCRDEWLAMLAASPYAKKEA